MCGSKTSRDGRLEPRLLNACALTLSQWHFIARPREYASHASALHAFSSPLGCCLSLPLQAEALPPGSGKRGAFVTGRLNDFELVGEKGTKCPNLSIGQADVKANVFVRFVFQYDK